MNENEVYDVARTGGNCAAFLREMIDMGYIPEHHLKQANEVMSGFDKAREAWRVAVWAPKAAA